MHSKNFNVYVYDLSFLTRVNQFTTMMSTFHNYTIINQLSVIVWVSAIMFYDAYDVITRSSAILIRGFQMRIHNAI